MFRNANQPCFGKCRNNKHMQSIQPPLLLPEEPFHVRKSSFTSTSSDSTTSTSDSFASQRTKMEGCIEWNPLMLHPPVRTNRSPCEKPQNDEIGIDVVDDIIDDYFGDGGHNTSMEQLDQLQRPKVSTHQIHDGFDFGFSNMSAQPLRTESPVSIASEMSASPQPRQHPADYGSFNHFIKRGTWKRRGIVFHQQEPLATDDDVFEIP